MLELIHGNVARATRPDGNYYQLRLTLDNDVMLTDKIYDAIRNVLYTYYQWPFECNIASLELDRADKIFYLHHGSRILHPQAIEDDKRIILNQIICQDKTLDRKITVQYSCACYECYRRTSINRLIPIEEMEILCADNGVKTFICDKCIATHEKQQCTSCYVYCDDDALTWIDEDRLCGSCAADQTYYCDDCDRTYYRNNACDCSSYQRCIYDYSYDVLRHHRESIDRAKLKRVIHFGVELEIEANYNQNYKKLTNTVNDLVKDFACLKHDGSIDHGFEIVTKPGTLKDHYQMWETFFDNRPSGLSSYNTETCGMHVHVGLPHVNGGRSGLASLTTCKIKAFLNQKKNTRFINFIAQRNLDNESFARRNDLKSFPAYARDNIRYAPVSVSGKNTIEFRLFKGNLRKESFFKNIEFCDAVINFVQNSTLTQVQEKGNVRNFIEFVNSKGRKVYPYLIAYLKDTSYEQKGE